MASNTAYRYTLQPYAGPSSRYTCPACRKPRCFTRYLDTVSGELLPPAFGRCDHEISCGHAYGPHQDVGIPKDSATTTQLGRQGLKRTTIARPLLTIPKEAYAATLGRYSQNTFARLLQRHFGAGVADEMLASFHVGTSLYWPGACIFWLPDQHGRIRGGQVVLYDESGHTVKVPNRHTTWAHTALRQVYRQRNEPVPAWLIRYAQEGQKSPCLFGLPQLVTAPAWKPIALVESAKTAILATPYFPEYTWLATMGLSYLTAERLEPLRGRRITLFPDAGALEKWRTKAQELCLLGFQVEVSEKLESLATPSERAAGLDLADILLREWPGYPPNWDDS